MKNKSKVANPAVATTVFDKFLPDNPVSSYRKICREIGDCHSREEEKAISERWANSLKALLESHLLDYEGILVCCKSLIHLSFLSYDTSFADTVIISLTQKPNINIKAAAYFACSAIFDSKHPLALMVLYSANKDIQGSDASSILLGLTLITNMPTPEVVQNSYKIVGSLLRHQFPAIRKRAALCFHAFLRVDPLCVVDYIGDICNLLNDEDPTVSNGALIVINRFIDLNFNVNEISAIANTFLDIAVKIAQDRYPAEYAFRRVPAPFNFIHSLRILRKLSKVIPEYRETIIPFLNATMLQFVNVNSIPSAAILREAMLCSIDYNNSDSQEFKNGLAAFMQNKSLSLNYVGLRFLKMVPRYSLQFQHEIIDCMQCEDTSINLETVKLLAYMATSSNIQIIIDSLFEFLPKAPNSKVRAKIASRIPPLAVKFATTASWLAKTLQKFFVLSGDSIDPLIAIIVNNSIDSLTDDMKREIVELYIEAAQEQSRMPVVFVDVIAHLLGHYAHLSTEHDLEFCSLLLCDLADDYAKSRFTILENLLHLSTKMEEIPPQVADIFVFYENSADVEVQEICNFALHLSSDLLKNVLSKELHYDAELSFLDKFVEENKTKDYVPPLERGVVEGDLHLNARDGDVTVELKTAEGPYESNPSSESKIESEVDKLETQGLDTVWGPEGIEEAPKLTNSQSIFDTKTTNMMSDPTPEPASLFSQFNKKNVSGKPAKVDKKKLALLDAFKSAAGEELGKAALDESGSIDLSKKAQKTPNTLGESLEPEEDAPPPPEFTVFNPTTTFKDQNIHSGFWINKGTLVVVVQNITPRDMKNFVMKLKVPQGIDAEIQTYPQITTLYHGRAFWLKAETKFTNLQKLPQINFSVQVDYEGHNLVVPLPITLFGFIEPVKMSTDEYGKLWTKGGKEGSVVIPKGNADVVKSIADVSEVIKEKLNFGSVQRIKEEEIFAAKIIGSDIKIQLHAKRTAVKIQIKILSPFEDLTQQLLASVPTFIKN